MGLIETHTLRPMIRATIATELLVRVSGDRKDSAAHFHVFPDLDGDLSAMEYDMLFRYGSLVLSRGFKHRRGLDYRLTPTMLGPGVLTSLRITALWS